MSRELGEALARMFAATERSEADALAYETDGLVRQSSEHVIQLCRMTDLLWGEIDVESHLLRVRDVIAPMIQAKEAASGSAGSSAPSDSISGR